MPVDIKVPQLGESVVEATVGQWLHREGDQVSAGESLVTLETDKVNVEVPAPRAGVLGSILKAEGDSVTVGEVLARVEEAAAHTSAQTSTPQRAQRNVAGTGTTQSSEGTGAETGVQAHLAGTNGGDGATSTLATADVAATPLARRIASEHGLDLRLIQGTGAGGRITHDDVNAYLAAQLPVEESATRGADSSTVATAPAPVPERQPPVPTPAISLSEPAPTISTLPIDASRPVERVRMSRRRQTIARRLVEAQHTAAMLTTFNEVDMRAIMELRVRRRDAFKERYGVSLGFMSFFTRAVIGALKIVPRLNAEIQGDDMVLKGYYDIGVAVATTEGLVVPVVRDADRLTFAQIEQRIAEVAAKARAGTLSVEDLRGGTFTITNGGTFGSLLSTPILNAPQVGILGMHKIEERPIARAGQVVVHPMMYVALSYDHRIVDGSEAVAFLVRVKDLLEDPEMLLLEA